MFLNQTYCLSCWSSGNSPVFMTITLCVIHFMILDSTICLMHHMHEWILDSISVTSFQHVSIATSLTSKLTRILEFFWNKYPMMQLKTAVEGIWACMHILIPFLFTINLWHYYSCINDNKNLCYNTMPTYVWLESCWQRLTTPIMNVGMHGRNYICIHKKCSIISDRWLPPR